MAQRKKNGEIEMKMKQIVHGEEKVISGTNPIVNVEKQKKRA
jgi:hypothetical protein